MSDSIYTVPPVRSEIISNLRLNALTPEHHARTCGYWYTITRYSTPHTAFRTHAALEYWLEARSLQLSKPLPEELGTFQSQLIIGEYINATWWDVDGFWALVPQRKRFIPVLSNGDYTLGIVTLDVLTEGPTRRVINTINVNQPRPILDREHARRELSELVREGVSG